MPRKFGIHWLPTDPLKPESLQYVDSSVRLECGVEAPMTPKFGIHWLTTDHLCSVRSILRLKVYVNSPVRSEWPAWRHCGVDGRRKSRWPRVQSQGSKIRDP